jgi:hypothetical protein
MRVDSGDGFSKVIWNSSSTGTKVLVYAEIGDIKILVWSGIPWDLASRGSALAALQASLV